MNLGEHIYKLRRAQGMSQDDLAAALEVSRQSVSKWENNSAVPELDKLIRLAQLFGLSLDELVGNVPPEPEVQPQPVINTQQQHATRLANVNILGWILIVGALAVSQILTSGSRFDGFEILLLMMPVALCGILCITTKHPDFYCGWVAVVWYWCCFFVLVPRWEEQTFLIFFGVALVVVMIFRTRRIHRSGVLTIPVWGWILGSLILIFAGILLLVNTVPFPWVGSSTSTVVP